MAQSKITPALWFHTPDGTMQTVIAYYVTIFGTDFQAGQVIPLGNTPSGNAEMCTITLMGNPYMLMSTEQEHHPFNDAFALMLSCADQSEIDLFWDYFTKEGKESMCGWCQDKFGLRWQVVPANMGELMSKPNAGQVMMGQKKIVIAEYV